MDDREPPTDEGERVALFVDGPNVLREEFDVDLDDVREAAAAEGHLVTTRLYLDEHATPGLIQAAEARGFEVIVTSGDVDVKLAVDAARFAAEGRMSTLAIAPGAFGRSDALRNAATDSMTLDEESQGDHDGDVGETDSDVDDVDGVSVDVEADAT